MSRQTHRLCGRLWTTQISVDEVPVVQAVNAITIASVTSSVASTAARTGPSEHSTAGILVSRNTGSRIPRTSGGATTVEHQQAAIVLAKARPPIDSNVGTAKYDTSERSSARASKPRYTCAPNRLAAAAWAPASYSSVDITVAPLVRKARVDGSGDRAQSAELAHHDAQREQRGVSGQGFSDGRHTGTRTGLTTEQLDGADRSWTADPVGSEPAVALEVLECPHGCGAEDAVGTTAVESELVERILELGDVVTAQLRCGEDQEAVAQPPAGLDECHPGVLVAGPAGVQAAQALEVGHRLARGRAEVTGRISRRCHSRRTEAALEVADRLAALSLPQREVTRQCVVARNSSSSCSRAPLLLAPTSRFETSPPENTSSVGMLITL